MGCESWGGCCPSTWQVLHSCKCRLSGLALGLHPFMKGLAEESAPIASFLTRSAFLVTITSRKWHVLGVHRTKLNSTRVLDTSIRKSKVSTLGVQCPLWDFPVRFLPSLRRLSHFHPSSFLGQQNFCKFLTSAPSAYPGDSLSWPMHFGLAHNPSLRRTAPE